MEFNFIQVKCPTDLHSNVKRLQIDRNEEGFRNDKGKKETVAETLIYLARKGYEQEMKEREGNN